MIGLIVKKSVGRGRGVFAARPFKKDALIERVPAIIIPKNEILEGQVLDNYAFEWNHDYYALPLGYALLYNHEDSPNMFYEKDFANESFVFGALRDIEVDEELTHNYGTNKDYSIVFTGKTFKFEKK